MITSPALLAIILMSTAVMLGVVAFSAWAEPFNGHLWPMSPYALTPLFDMLAFCFVCVYASTLVLRHRLHTYAPNLVRIFAVTALIMMVIHPSLLFWQLWRDGFGLPPMSYLHLYTDDQLVGITLGTTGYLVTGIALLYSIVRATMVSRFSVSILMIGGAGMFWYSLLVNVFIQESWFMRVWIACGGLFGIAVGWLLLRSRD